VKSDDKPFKQRCDKDEDEKDPFTSGEVFCSLFLHFVFGIAFGSGSKDSRDQVERL
jgi:hypothetical protein